MQKIVDFVLHYTHAVHVGTALVHRYLHLARRVYDLTNVKEDAILTSLKHIFAVVQQLLKARPNTMDFAGQSIRLYLQAADIANNCQLADLTYELFEEVSFSPLLTFDVV